MAPRGAIFVSSSVFVTVVLDDYHLVGVTMMAPALMPAAITMLAELGACAVAMMLTTTLDHVGLCARNRRRRDGDRAKRCNDVTKLFHVVLLDWARIKHRIPTNVPQEPEENSEQLFSKGYCAQQARASR